MNLIWIPDLTLFLEADSPTCTDEKTGYGKQYKIPLNILGVGRNI